MNNNFTNTMKNVAAGTAKVAVPGAAIIGGTFIVGKALLDVAVIGLGYIVAKEVVGAATPKKDNTIID